MEQEDFVQIARKVVDKMISLSHKKKVENKKIIEVYDEVLEKKYLEYRLDILAYVPLALSEKGYEFVNQKFFELKKY